MATEPCSACTVMVRLAVKFCVPPVSDTLPRTCTSRVALVPIFCVALLSTSGLTVVPCSFTSPTLDEAASASAATVIFVPAPPTNKSPSVAVKVAFAAGVAPDAAIT